LNVNRNPDPETINWSDLNRWRQKFRKTLPPIHALPILPSLAYWMIQRIENAEKKPVTVLDVGAGPRNLFEKLEPVKEAIIYKSQDIDRSQYQDYYDTGDITETFDIVTTSEVIEHLETREKISFVDELFRLTKPGGHVALTTPNANHPTIFWRDFTHVMPIHYLDLAGVLARAGFTDVAIYRLTKMSFRKRLTVWYYKRLLKLLHCDFAQSILAIAKRPDA